MNFNGYKDIIINMARILKIGGFEGEISSYADLFQKGYDYYNLFSAFRDFYDAYLAYNSKDKRMLMCINTTKLYWRSPLQLALMACNFTQKELRLLVLPFLDISSWIKRKYISPMVLGYFL